MAGIVRWLRWHSAGPRRYSSLSSLFVLLEVSGKKKPVAEYGRAGSHMKDEMGFLQTALRMRSAGPTCPLTPTCSRRRSRSYLSSNSPRT